jgi:hypothetical protein
MESAVQITREAFDDRSEPDEAGMHDYIYTGFYYSFRYESHELVFAVYSDTPTVAALKGPIEWRPDVYASDLFRQAVEHLRDSESVETIEVCDPTPPGRGFIPLAEAIQLARAAGLPVPKD